MLLLFFSIFVSLIEAIGVAAIMPFISIASDFSTIHTNKYYQYVFNLFSFKNNVSFVLFFGIILLFFYILRSGINLIYFHTLSKFSKGRYHHLAYRLFENYLGRSYQDFTDSNTSYLTKTIVNEANNLTNILSSLLLIISEIFVVILIYSMMLYMNWKITLLITAILVLNSTLLIKTISKRIKQQGTEREECQKKFYEILSSAFGNFKMIKLKSNDDEILNKFHNASYGYAQSEITSQTLSHFPRLILEALGFVIVIFIVIYLVVKYQQDISTFMALISMFILGLYRLMPSANRVLNSYNQIIYYYDSLNIVHNDIIYEIEDLNEENMAFNHQIVLKDISFSYTENKQVLQNISLTIQKGSKIAFIGESGSGKSTLVDIIMGLYKPKKGSLYIDGILLNNDNIKSWRQRIGYIPQHIYLFDGSVGENVAFGEVYNPEKIKEALTKANLLEFLETHHYGIDTKVGENGLKLSGGQKQRVAIARALYGDPELLILDEATSALDNKTEEKIMEEIYNLSSDKTLIIIAHRLSTIKKCDKIYTLNKGSLI